MIGYAYPNDMIRVTQSDFMTHTFKVDTTNLDSNRVGSFYEKFSYFTFNGNASVNIEIDSSGIKLLDTLLIFDEKNTAPFVSFEKPTENNFKRKFFIGDDRKIPKI